ncbi:MAG: heme-binding protein, partial [Candidatus Woesebacteria bacterium]|nr:heme-binding protein [Candidatus Woesebacteria bacterium]
MKKRCRPLIFLALGLLLGEHAMATEEPKFEILSQQGVIELRRYPAFVVAETTVEGDMDAASNQGFRAIADYIFGNNQSALAAPNPGSEKIAMTAPVTLEPVAAAAQKIAMTAPVAIEPLNSAAPSAPTTPSMQGGKRWRVHFVMPSQYTLSSLPKPNNAAVRLRQVPAKTWAVLRYSGFNSESRVQQKTDELAAWLLAQNMQTLGSPQLARYDPPWTLP